GKGRWWLIDRPPLPQTRLLASSELVDDLVGGHHGWSRSHYRLYLLPISLFEERVRERRFGENPVGGGPIADHLPSDEVAGFRQPCRRVGGRQLGHHHPKSMLQEGRAESPLTS
ncbi:hypothetical protein CRG98_022236, partial [Punica granatum]